MLDRLVTLARVRLDKRRRYKRAVAEINALSNRDLTDMRADRADMLYWARKDILG